VKKLKILAVLVAILLALPGYYRNRPAVDHVALGMWTAVEGVWLHFAFQSKQLGYVVGSVVSGRGSGKSIPSQRAAEIEAVKESQKQIDEQEQKDATGKDGGAVAIDKLRESDEPHTAKPGSAPGSR
jgi:hypothetical protein